MYTATYSPEDNKLRLYAATRLDKETYERVRAAGFIYAPKQELFVAPMWTPSREDLLLELADEIGDEDTTLVERQEARAERFGDYSDACKEDAEQARQNVERITNGIPMGQPILVGHHSERHARKDAERIENGMRRAVKMWETAEYWRSRAAGAIRHAKYKELPAVRARRIKGLEADQRKNAKTKAELEKLLRFWSKADVTPEQAIKVANYFDHSEVTLADGSKHYSAWSALTDGKITVAEVQRQRTEHLPHVIAHYDRWLNHIANRLEYERAMLAESGGTEADKTRPEVGGACRAWCSWRGGYSTIQKVNKVSVTLLDNWGNGGADFKRTIPFDKLSNLLSKAQVDEFRKQGRLLGETPRGFHLSGNAPEPQPTQPEIAHNAQTDATDTAEAIDAIKDSLRAGVKVVSAPQLFPTPANLASRMVALAEIEDGNSVLEPSAGTGRLLDALISPDQTQWNGATISRLVAVELNSELAKRLRTTYACADVREGDFLERNGDLGKFDRVIMNPPFQNAADIKHIEHALTFLKPGGKLVALCANGPRQNATLKPLTYAGGSWQDLPADSFTEEGTGVRVALVVIQRATEAVSASTI
jgi:phospholipid N-methyltransferase